MPEDVRWAARPYDGHAINRPLEPDHELLQVGPGTPGGEYFRRFWQPVALSSQLGDLPVAIRILGEELVVFRDLEGTVGLLHKHCAHRRASLEYGRIEQRGIRCCYHGWHYDIDGTILETPGEPEDSPIRHEICQGAYPVHEHKGLVFAYMGPLEKKADFPLLRLHGHPRPRHGAVLDPLALQLAAGERKRDGPLSQHLPAREGERPAIPRAGAFRGAAGRGLPQAAGGFRLQPFAAQGRFGPDPLPRPIPALDGAERRHVPGAERAEDLQPHKPDQMRRAGRRHQRAQVRLAPLQRQGRGAAPGRQGRGRLGECRFLRPDGAPAV